MLEKLFDWLVGPETGPLAALVFYIVVVWLFLVCGLILFIEHLWP